ncbi:MAG: hypothetical protein ACYTBJ_05380 [Planctomycetota bacterium]|jgi:hypothetical protein
MADAKTIPGKSQLLIDAMGAGEWWGSNRNGDHFPEDQLSHKGKDYGHETFMHYAYPFRHHVNKDPKRAYGDKVILSVYHPGMHRVQLIVAVHDEKCRDILSQVDNGDYPDVSMGCRVPYDQCSICGNRAKNRRQYCQDLKYRMNKILPDGRRVTAINWRPKFFDISFVLIGAEKASHVLMKVASEQLLAKSSAELGEKYYTRRGWWKGADFKEAAVKKQGTITKKVPLDVKSIKPVIENAPEVKSLEPSIPPAVLNSLAGFPLSEIFSTLAFMGIDPKPEEFQKIVLIKSGHQKTAALWESQGAVFDEYSGTPPSNASDVIDISYTRINEKIAYLMRPYIPHRSCFTAHLMPRLEKYAEDDSQWYPSSSKSILTGVPLAAGLAGLYAYVKGKAPKESMTKFDKAISRHPWLLGLLFALGAGGAAAGVELLRPQPLGNLDSSFGHGYNPHYKTASKKKYLIPLALAPLSYMYSGVQRSRARRGERLGRFDRFIAQRPDLAAIAALVAGPSAVAKGSNIAKGLKRFMKTGGIHADFGAFALTSGAKLLPAAVLGAMVDATIVKKISKIVENKRRQHGNPR